MTKRDNRTKVLGHRPEDAERIFDVSTSEVKRVMKNFRLEMEKGLTGKASSLKMIPTYVSRPTGREKGKFIALDLGGTNFRILQLELKGRGRIGQSRIMKFVLEKKHINGSAAAFFDFIAVCVKTFLKRYRPIRSERVDLGFTFSFPVKQKSVSSGSLVCWTKDFKVRGVVGRDVVKLFQEALARNGVYNVEVAALANDTVGTLVAKSYQLKNCDIGVILGTGTNACYPERIKNIKKLPRSSGRSGEMIINIEWGNFNKLRLTRYDMYLDKNTSNPGKQILEKMVSGMYLGKLAGILLKERFGLKGEFLSEYMSVIEGDRTNNLRHTGSILAKLGTRKLSLGDRKYVKRICTAVSRRAARLSAGCIAAIIRKIDPSFVRKHFVAIDGSVYEKHPTFELDMRSCLKEIFPGKSSRIGIGLAKDGSGKGAAIIAAVAAENQ